MAVGLSNAAANAEANSFSALLNNGYLRIYSGTRPANADTALSGNTLLAELRFSATAAPNAVAGVITFNAITSDTDAKATGTASFARYLELDGSTVVCDVNVGTSGSDINLDSTAIQIHAQVDVTSLTHTVTK